MSLRRGLLRCRLFVAFCLAAFLTQLAGPALGQTINLTAVNVQPQHNGAVRITLTFSSGVPKYQVYGNGSNQLTVLLFATTPAANAPTAIPAVGPITTGQVTTVGTTTTIGLYTRDAANLRATTGAGQTLVLELASTRTSVRTPSPPPGASAPTIMGNQGVITKVVQLKYADISEVVGILSGTAVSATTPLQPQANAGNFGSPSTLGSGTSGGGVGGFGPQSSPSVAYASVSAEGGAQDSIGQRINEHLAIDRRLNALIFTGTPAEIASYEAIVDAIDIPLRSVMLQTEIVELTDTAAKNVGIDFTNGSGTGQIASATFTTPNTQNGITSNVPNQVSLQAAIYAQVQKGNGRIIATPRILALDGKPASILTGDALPIITSIAVSGVNAVQQQVEYVNVGVNLQILARSTADGHVTAQVFSAVSSVTGYTSSYPNIAQRQASTTVTVKDGQPFVLGGLLEKNELYNLYKVPFLGDLPLLGGLFRVRHDSATTDNLYIVVTPQIVVPDGPSPPTIPTPATIPNPATPSPAPTPK